MTKVILINGPARSGKDTLANKLVDIHTNYLHPLKDHTHVYDTFKFAGMMQSMWREVFWDYLAPDETEYRRYVDGDLKNEIFPPLGVSFRNSMISFSEEYIKPRYGEDFFGRYTAQKIARQQLWYPNKELVALVSDSGFQQEAVAVIEKFGAENVLHIRLFRQGCSFVGDSRNYIDLEPFGVKMVDLENIGLDKFIEDGNNIVRDFVDG